MRNEIYTQGVYFKKSVVRLDISKDAVCRTDENDGFQRICQDGDSEIQGEKINFCVEAKRNKNGSIDITSKVYNWYAGETGIETIFYDTDSQFTCEEA